MTKADRDRACPFCTSKVATRMDRYNRDVWDVMSRDARGFVDLFNLVHVTEVPATFIIPDGGSA
ncbi:MAG: hypothetical protein AAF429_09405 [Pseudomonadota bacterium]